MRILHATLLLCCLCACAGKQQSPPALPDCEALFVILPGNFIVDLAAGSRVILDPAVQEFALFCTGNEAREALANVQPAGDWRIYRLDGEFAELATQRGEGYILAKPAKAIDWLEAQ